jgi:hypothetical protein
VLSPNLAASTSTKCHLTRQLSSHLVSTMAFLPGTGVPKLFSSVPRHRAALFHLSCLVSPAHGAVQMVLVVKAVIALDFLSAAQYPQALVSSLQTRFVDRSANSSNSAGQAVFHQSKFGPIAPPPQYLRPSTSNNPYSMLQESEDMKMEDDGEEITWSGRRR